MALKATIFKADLSISDMTRNYYHDHSVTIARHPSETDERMMVRLLAFALHAHEDLAFGNKIGSEEDEPDLWQKDPTGTIELWVDVGQPEEKLVRKACGRARQVAIYTYSGHGATVWWRQNGPGFERLKNLTVINLPAAAAPELAKLAQRTMKFTCTIQDGQVWVSDGSATVHIDLQPAMTAG